MAIVEDEAPGWVPGEAPRLAVGFSLEDDRVVLSLTGDLDAETAEAFRSAIDEWPGGPAVAVDVSRLTFIDSVGIGCLLRIQRRVADAGGVLVVRGAPRAIRRTLEMTGVSRLVALLD